MRPNAANAPSGASVEHTGTLVLAENRNRTAARFTNISDTIIYLSLGSPAKVPLGIPLAANGGSFELNATNMFTGPVYAIHDAVGEVKDMSVQEW